MNFTAFSLLQETHLHVNKVFFSIPMLPSMFLWYDVFDLHHAIDMKNKKNVYFFCWELKCKYEGGWPLEFQAFNEINYNQHCNAPYAPSLIIPNNDTAMCLCVYANTVHTHKPLSAIDIFLWLSIYKDNIISDP